jgi:hypothetical protein
VHFDAFAGEQQRGFAEVDLQLLTGSRFEAFSRSICATSSGVCIMCLPVVSMTGKACTTPTI